MYTTAWATCRTSILGSISIVPLACTMPSAIVLVIAAVNLPSIPAGAVSADIAIEGANVRWRDDGQSPTASVGMPLAQDASMIYRGNLAAIQFIQQSVGAILNVSYYK